MEITKWITITIATILISSCSGLSRKNTKDDVIIHDTKYSVLQFVGDCSTGGYYITTQVRKTENVESEPNELFQYKTSIYEDIAGCYSLTDNMDSIGAARKAIGRTKLDSIVSSIRTLDSLNKRF